MKILVTGGAGYIGSHTAKLLAAAGHEPVIFDDLSQGHEWAVKWGRSSAAACRSRRASRTCSRAHHVDGVVHFAASALVGESMTQPGQVLPEQHRRHAQPARGDARRRASARIVFSSTCATYGDPVRVPIDEAHPQAPVNPYGESKLMVETDAPLVRRDPRPALDGAALLQRRRRGSRRRDRRGPRSRDAPDPARHRRGAGHASAGRDLRHRLPDARRHRRPRLHPRRRIWPTRTCARSSDCGSGRRARRSISAPAAAIPSGSGRRRRRASVAGGAGRGVTAPRRRPGGARCRAGARARGARLDLPVTPISRRSCATPGRGTRSTE